MKGVTKKMRLRRDVCVREREREGEGERERDRDRMKGERCGSGSDNIV